MHKYSDTDYTLDSDQSPSIYDGYKITECQKIILLTILKKDPECPSSIAIAKLSSQNENINISLRQVNRLRVEWNISRRKGRPRKECGNSKDEPEENVYNFSTQVSYIGVHIFNVWLEQQNVFNKITDLIRELRLIYWLDHKEEDFALLFHRESTILDYFKALFYAPLFNIFKLTEYDLKKHPLSTLIGRSLQSSTLNQFLGQLERINAGEVLNYALISENEDKLAYIDGHMIAFWTRESMHKGKITMLGRIMAGSQAVVAHNAKGKAIFLDYFQADIHLTQVIEKYCETIVSLTGIDIFVIDREVNSVGMARLFEEKHWGLLSMLDSNEYDGLSSFETIKIGTLENGNSVYEGKWKISKENDPRIFVIIEEEGRILPFWGTSRVKEGIPLIEWPKTYRDRSEIQEKSFRRMINHGGLNINYGIKKIMGIDRHQQRQFELIDEKLLNVRKKITKKETEIDNQMKMIEDSKSKGQVKRLVQRQNALEKKQEKLEKHAKKEEKLKKEKEELGLPKQRADRDLRKQKIMTIRTLLLENTLIAFFLALLEKVEMKIGLDTLIALFFDRSGTIVESPTQIVYRLDINGVSEKYRSILEDIVQGINAMDLSYKGKFVKAMVRIAPT